MSWPSIEVRTLGADDIALIATIDRTEHVDVEYRLVDGQLEARAAKIPDIPAWDPHGSGDHSVASLIDFCRVPIARGAALLGAYGGERQSLMGLVVVEPLFEPPMAWLTLLHVSRPHRRQGAASALWKSAAEVARDAGARSMYVSATPTESAIGFYLRQGCQLADPVHPDLFAMEPDDIHLVCALEP